MANLRTPLYDWHVAHKARMVPFGGWDMPVQYAGVIPEHTAVRKAVGLFDISHMARVSFHGKDVLPVLEKVFTNSVASMKDGQVRYGLICNEAGGMLDDVLVYKWPTGYTMVMNASNREKIVTWLTQQAAGMDFKVEDNTFTSAMIAVQGPKSVDTVRGLFAADVSGLKYYYAMATQYKDTPCIVSRTGYTGEDGFEVIVPNNLATTLWDECVAKGAVPCGLGARDTLRLEAAMPLYGHELNDTTDPIRAGLGWAVKVTKGEFIGRGAMVEALANPTAKPIRVGLKLDGKRAAREGFAVVQLGKVIGTVTSGSYVPYLEQSIAMAYVEPAFATPGTSLAIDARGTEIPATVVPLPFYQRPKS